jgi:hypothetical protein
MYSAMKSTLRSTTAKLPLPRGAVAVTGAARARLQAQEIALEATQEKAQEALRSENRELVRMFAYFFGALFLFFGVMYLFIRA